MIVCQNGASLKNQWRLYLLVLSATAFFHDAPYLTHSDDKIAISHWLAFGNPTLLRLGNSNKFDCSRLNRSVSRLAVQTSSVYLFGLRLPIADGTREKRDCLPSLLEQKHISLFYRNSHKAILNPHQYRRKTKFFQKFLAGVVLIFLAMLFVRCFLEFGAQTLQSHSADYLTKRLCDKN